MLSRREVCKSLAMMPFLGIPSLTSKSLVETKPDLYSDVPKGITITEWYTNTPTDALWFINTDNVGAIRSLMKAKFIPLYNLTKSCSIKNDIDNTIKQQILDTKRCRCLNVVFNTDGRIGIFTCSHYEYEILDIDKEILEKKVCVRN